MNAMPEILLASKSPRRCELFSLITPRFTCTTAPVDERSVDCADAATLCERLAQLKCRAVAKNAPDKVVVGSDTVVELDGAVLGKPSGESEAREMLRALSGRTHRVHTGVCIAWADGERSFSCMTEVTFLPIPDAEIALYIRTAEPYDKAGGYGIQGWAARWTERINGDFFNVMGLPVSRVYAALSAENFV